MAFNNLTPVTIGDGDPVTADVLRKIVENINIIAKGETVTPVKIESTTINGGVVSVRGLNTTIGGIIEGKTLKTDMKSFPVTWTGIVFDKAPTVNVTIEYASATDASALYTPHILNVTADQFKIICKAPKGAKTITTAKIHWTASGNTTSLTE